MKRVLFVCSGNLCRSPMAEGLLRKLLQQEGIGDIEVQSAGTLGIIGDPASANAVIACRQLFGADISAHRSQGIRGDLLQQADLVLCMAERHRDAVCALQPEATDRTFLLKAFAGSESTRPDVFDPVGLPLEVYLTSCREIEALLRRMLPNLRGYLGGEMPA